MRIVFAGTPEFAVPSLERLILDKYRIVAVYTQPDRESGRGRSLAVSPVKRTAVDLNLPVMQPVSFREAETVSQLANFQPDIMIVAAFGQILPQSVIDIPPYGCINIHPSLLPRHRGASPVAAAILIAQGTWDTKTMVNVEELDPDPFIELLNKIGLPTKIQETQVPALQEA